jgi:YidC/Oxa1 family membrane protein insertase
VIAVAWWQGLLDGLGWFLARLYDLIPNYGVAIILLTLAIRVLLLPLGLKQIRSMQAMQAIQPQIKQLQQKYKGDKQKLNEEMMKLYKERGVNPLAGCLPMLLQFPILIALYAVLRFPSNVGAVPQGSNAQPNPHIPSTSQLYTDSVEQRSGVKFVGTNLMCSALQAGKQVDLEDPKTHKPLVDENGRPFEPLDCGSGIPARIPYYFFALLMVGSTFYQQRQMQKASPAGAQQQQALLRIMPILFGVWGFLFPAGLVVYWTTSNLVQISQQHFLLRARPKDVVAGGKGDGKGAAGPRPARRGFFASMLDRAEEDRARRQGVTSVPSAPKTAPKPPRDQSAPPPKSSGAKSARSRKKRRKR